MKRFSIYFLFGLSAIVCMAAFDYYSTRSYWVERYKKDFLSRADRLNDEALVARSLYEARADQGILSDFLESRRRTHSLDFWALYQSGVVRDTALAPEQFERFKFNLSAPSAAIMTDRDHPGGYFYAVEGLNDDYQLVVGVQYSPDAFVSYMANLDRAFLIRYLSIMFLIVLGIFVYFLRDIVGSLRELGQKQDSRSFGKIKAHSREADLLLRGFSAYETKTRELEQEKDLYSWQVLPSLRTELQSGRKPPYDFACTLVRTDINNFSKIYNENPVEEFAATINEFFTDVSHVVARYGGMIHEFVGDEVIYYFKDEDVGHSVATALAAVRDVNDVAARYHATTLKERGYPFTVKSSLAQGRLRFGRFVNGYGLAGPVLIETVRILSHVHEKDGNVVVFDQRHCAAIAGVAKSESYANVRLKGFNDERQLVIYRGHDPVEIYLRRADARAMETLNYYRGDQDLLKILTWAKESVDLAGVSRAIGFLRLVKVTKGAVEVQRALVDWIAMLVADVEHHAESSATLRVLSAALKLFENLVPRGELQGWSENVIKRATELKDRRVVANALDVLTWFSAGSEESISEKLTLHEDNRVAANALVHEGMRSLSAFVVKRLYKMLQSKQTGRVASGLYALGEIANHHHRRDPVYLSAQFDFMRLIYTLPEFACRDDAMIRRQALIAARKSGQVEVIEQIRQSIQDQPGSPLLAEEIDAHLGSTPASRKRAA